MNGMFVILYDKDEEANKNDLLGRVWITFEWEKKYFDFG